MIESAHEPGAGARLLSFQEGNALLHISGVTAKKWAKRADSRLPRPFKHGGRWRYFAEHIEGYLRREAERAQNSPMQQQDAA